MIYTSRFLETDAAMSLQITVFAVLSFHILHFYDLTSSNQHCDGGGMSSVNGDSSTQLGLCWFDQQECSSNGTDIICKIALQEDNTRCSKEQLCVEVCTNNTNCETTVCKLSASLYHLAWCQRTPGNLSVLQNMTDSESVSLMWSQSLCNYSILCCPAPYNMTDCIPSSFDEYENDENSTTITGFKLYTSYECCVWSIHGGAKGQQMCRSVQTTEAGDREAAHTATMGKINSLPQERMITLLLSIAIGLLILILITVVIVAVIICNRMHKQNKRLTREIQEYEMITKYSAVRHDTGSLPDRYLAIKKRDSNRKQPLYPPAHLAADYLTPTMTKTTEPIKEKKADSEEKAKMDEGKNTDSEDKEKTKTNEPCDKNSEENPYQSLIVSRTDKTTLTPDGYVKIIRSRVGSLEEETLPPNLTPVPPPKPEPDYSLKSLTPQLSLASNLPTKSENLYESRSGTS